MQTLRQTCGKKEFFCGSEMALAKVYKTSLDPAMVISLLFSTSLLAAIGATASPTVEIPRYDLENTDALLAGAVVDKGLDIAEEAIKHSCPGNADPEGDLSKARYHILEEAEADPIDHKNTDITNSNDSTTTQTTTPEGNSDAGNLNTWSVAWYLTLLGAFIIFFILIGLTEIFCRRRARESRWHTARRDGGQLACQAQLENVEPPPSYDLFKPPSYSTLFPPEVVKLPPKAQDGSPPQHKQLVYVVSVHGGRGVS
ncbi:hypothetical protein J437_LFUL017372 [Ladona fulva]|uniref:Uncharacterized protein n=1 Tax=Ladona fulva TaxID=123851 RepID=A0A8K0PB22_LADFU|nr:hypothetical protein J437_LFUL017372 [Ladona fulva]